MADTKKTRALLIEDVKYIQNLLKSEGYYKGILDGDFGPGSRVALESMKLHARFGRGATSTVARTITDTEIRSSATKFSIPFSAVKSVIAVESGGGWYTDERKDIVDLDGPGGFIDGDLLKILFEAKWFHSFTGGKYDETNPNISSPTWNRKLYFGGQNEYKRFWEAAQLDAEAAFKATSWGMFQIMGFNHKLAGYDSAQAMVEAFKQGEQVQLEAFLTFISNVKHKGKLLIQWLREKNWAMFAEGYNGAGYAANQYDVKLAREDKKWIGL